jgi:hypothetical protein
MSHPCVTCTAPDVPYSAPVCARCRRALPPRIRKRLLADWRTRIVAPAGWQDSLIEALMWRQEYVVYAGQDPGDGG